MGEIESTLSGRTNTEVNIFEGLTINNTLLNTLSMGSKQGMLNSWAAGPSKTGPSDASMAKPSFIIHNPWYSQRPKAAVLCLRKQAAVFLLNVCWHGKLESSLCQTFYLWTARQEIDVCQMDAPQLRVMMQSMFCNFCNLQDQGPCLPLFPPEKRTKIMSCSLWAAYREHSAVTSSKISLYWLSTIWWR